MSNFKPNYFQRRSKPQGPKANERIRALDVQVIGSDGGNLGSMPLNKAIELAQKLSISPNNPNFSFGQLYGMSDNITFSLAKRGYRVVKYLPFGPVKEVIPYLIRRANENTSVSGQSSRELDLISKELKRRKN